MAAFMDQAELVQLTGFTYKSKQIEWLRKEGVPFRVTATGHPAVLWSAIDSTNNAEPLPTAAWQPRVLENA